MADKVGEAPQSVKDALADAETLRKAVFERTYSRRTSNGQWPYLHGRARTEPIREAFGKGTVAAATVEGRTPDVAYRNAFMAARAAFRAVPALREEE